MNHLALSPIRLVRRRTEPRGSAGKSRAAFGSCTKRLFRAPNVYFGPKQPRGPWASGANHSTPPGQIAPPTGAIRTSRTPRVKAVPCELKQASLRRPHPSVLADAGSQSPTVVSVDVSARLVTPASPAPTASLEPPPSCRPGTAPERPLSRRPRGCHCGRQDREPAAVGFRSMFVGGLGGRVVAVGRWEERPGAERGAGTGVT